jgi:transcriptional regulator with XRE-family HTH domain
MPKNDFVACFAEIVRDKRKHLKITQETLAEKSNLSWKMISLIERKQRNPSIAVAERIAQGLSIPLWRLVKNAEEAKKNRTKQP